MENLLRRSFEDHADARSRTCRLNALKATAVRSCFEAIAAITHEQAGMAFAQGAGTASILTACFDEVPEKAQSYAFLIARSVTPGGLDKLRRFDDPIDDDVLSRHAYLRFFLYADSEEGYGLASIDAYRIRPSRHRELPVNLGAGPSERVDHDVIIKSMSAWIAHFCPDELRRDIGAALARGPDTDAFHAPRGMAGPA